MTVAGYQKITLLLLKDYPSNLPFFKKGILTLIRQEKYPEKPG